MKEDNKEHTPYEVLCSITKKNFIPTDEELKTINSFMLTKMLSNDINSIDVSNILNFNPNMPIKAQYWLSRTCVNSFKYIDKAKKKKPTEEEKTIMIHFGVSLAVAKSYIARMSEEELKSILDLYKEGKI